MSQASRKTTKPAKRSKSEEKNPSRGPRLRLKLRTLLFGLLLISGILPLGIISWLTVRENRDILQTKENEILLNAAQTFASRLSTNLAHRKDQLRQLGHGLLAPPGYANIAERLQSEWIEAYLRSFTDDHPELIAFRVVNQEKTGLILELTPLENQDQINEVMGSAMIEALETGAPVYRLVPVSRQQDTGVVIAAPVPAGDEILVVEALVPQKLSSVGVGEGEDLFLIDAQGQLLWSPPISQQDIEAQLLTSNLIEDFVSRPMSFSREYDFTAGSREVSVLARVVPVEETGWGVLAYKDTEQVFRQVQAMVWSSVLSALVLVVVALGVALVAAQGFSRPIQRLVEASHEISAGNFDRRVKTRGLVFGEIADLATDFNRMSETVQNYIEQLRQAARANRELFISSIRAFAAAIDAKDPYTRGHSERVASYSRAIAQYLGLPKDIQERVWISAVLHDVGKIGIEDRILKKMGVLTPEEFDQMKLHPVIGAEIVEPILALREMIPGIRWHHEAWNGTGYPDKLKGEQIPLMARIIGVADTFDAITTNRPYQNAYSTDYAIQTIKKLTGKKFDAKIVTAFLLAYEAGHIAVGQDAASNKGQVAEVSTAQAVAN